MPEEHGKPNKPEQKNRGCAAALAAALMWVAIVVVYFNSTALISFSNQVREHLHQTYADMTRPAPAAVDNGPQPRHDDIPIPNDIKKLPGVSGWGKVPSMHQVMATDGGRLRALIELYAASHPKEAQKMVWNIILVWTGMVDVDPASYPRYKGDARKLLAMEALTGTRFGTNPDGTFTPPHLGPTDHANLEKYYEEWGRKVNSCLLLSSHYIKLYHHATNARIENRKNAYAPLMRELRRIYETDGKNGKFIVVDFIRQLRVYDSRGIANARNLKKMYYAPDSSDEFIRVFSDGFAE